MNVLFVDIDGVLNNVFDNYNIYVVEETIIVLKKMCELYNAKVVISSSCKPNPYYEEDGEEPKLTQVHEALQRHGIELLGHTPLVSVEEGFVSIGSLKEFEIIYYLETHPEIEHFAILDDNDNIDFGLLRSHLIEVGYYDEEGHFKGGLRDEDIPAVGEALKLDNPYRNLIAQEREYRVRRRERQIKNQVDKP